MWKCAVCSVFVAVTLRLLIAHIYMKHSQNPGFMCRCNVDRCPRIYTKWNSYYRHVHREHAQLLDQHNNHNVEQENNDDINYVQQPIEDRSTDAVADGPEINENDDVVEENRQNTVERNKSFEQKQRVVKYIMNLKEMHKIRETSAEFIAVQTNAIVKQHIEILKGKLFGRLQGLNINHTDLEFIDELLDEELPFDGLITAYQRNKFIRSSFRVVEAEVISVGQAPHIARRMGKHQMQIEDITFSYIPMIQSIQQFLQNEQISDCVFQQPLFSPLGFMCDLVNGTIFKHHDLFVENNNALRIVLYYDDLEICNPLSKQAGTHKIGVFYYLLANLPISYRSRLPAIRILSIIKRNVMSEYGINKVLDRIKTDLDSLSHGVEMNINGRNQIVKGAAIAFVGDTLASHEFCGFKIGVGFSFQKCRECECTYDDMQTKFHERFFTARYLEGYDQQCAEMDIAFTRGMRDRLSTVYGINTRSSARDFPHFNMISMTPEDIMHVIFEGVALYGIKAALNSLAENEVLSLDDLNNIIGNFPYGYKDRESVPGIIPESVFCSNDSSLSQTASSMMTFLKLISFFLIEKLNCDAENEHIKFIKDLCEIVKIIMAPVISLETIQMLHFLIETHLHKFKNIFPNKSIIPKQHYLVHVPTAIERFGPLTQVWSMRFEGKHKFIKQRMSGNNNFKNIVKSLTERCVMYEASLNVGDDHLLFSKDTVIGKSKPVTNLLDCKREINAFFGTSVDDIQSIYSVNWIIYNGQKYKCNECQIAFGENDSLPEFGTLNNIWISYENIDDEIHQQFYFLLEMLETVGYNENIQSFEVKKALLAQGLELVKIENIFVHIPLHFYVGKNNTTYICVPFDIVDLIRLKQST